jgi:hypothetical protein
VKLGSINGRCEAVSINRVALLVHHGGKVKVKVPRNRLESPEGGRFISLHSLDLGARRGGWSPQRPCRVTPRKDPVPIVQEAGWAPGPVWTGAINVHLKTTCLFHDYFPPMKMTLTPECVFSGLS